jgi:hypothetical protein
MIIQRAGRDLDNKIKEHTLHRIQRLSNLMRGIGTVDSSSTSFGTIFSLTT